MLTSDFATVKQILDVVAQSITTNATLQQAEWQSIVLVLNGHRVTCNWLPATNDWDVQAM